MLHEIGFFLLFVQYLNETENHFLQHVQVAKVKDYTNNLK